ncbi:MAG TPA: response regulator [Nitriliruptorales bacterium]
MIIIALSTLEGPGHEPLAVLVVDDDPDIRMLIRIHLELAGYAVHEARNGEDALLQLGEQLFDGVVLDLRMPGIDGFEVLETMRDRGLLARTPVLTCSAHADEDVVATLSRSGTSGHVAKPFRPDQLIDAVGRMLNGHAA